MFKHIYRKAAIVQVIGEGVLVVSKTQITQERLKELFNYDEETGLFTRIKSTTNSVKVGSIAGAKQVTGYLAITIDNRKHYCHRLAWLYMTGSLPEKLIDHINHNKTDNRFKNLRVVTRAANAKNMKLPSTNTSGALGVQKMPSGKWRVKARFNGAHIHVGYFDSFSDAVAARKAADVKYGYHPNHGAPKTARRSTRAFKELG